MKLNKDFEAFHESSIGNRFIKHNQLQGLLQNLNSKIFNIEEAGTSAQGRSIYLVKAGTGETRVFLWSQMHGDEATATMALMDLLNFLGSANKQSSLRDSILNNCTLYIAPMINPDGAEVFTRRNSQGIDINRDFHHGQSPEGRVLKALREKIQPEFGFNLHDQSTLWSAGKSGNPATISLLAPAYDEQLSVNPVRQKAMQVISAIYRQTEKLLPGHTGRYFDEYEPRAFGDNFQAAGTSTILIEAGGYKNDPEKQLIRKLKLQTIVTGLSAIASGLYKTETLEDYFSIPQNEKRHFHIILKNCMVQLNDLSYRADIGLVATEVLNADGRSVSYNYSVEDFGDLSGFFAYEEVDSSSYKLILTQPLELLKSADLILQDGLETILCIENGLITNKNF